MSTLSGFSNNTKLREVSNTAASSIRMQTLLPNIARKFNERINNWDWFPSLEAHDWDATEYANRAYYQAVERTIGTMRGNAMEDFVLAIYKAAKTESLLSPTVIDFHSAEQYTKKGQLLADYDLIFPSGSIRVELTQTRDSKNAAGRAAARGCILVCLQEEDDGRPRRLKKSASSARRLKKSIRKPPAWIGRKTFSEWLFNRPDGFDGWFKDRADVLYCESINSLIQNYKGVVYERLLQHGQYLKDSEVKLIN